MGSTRNGKIGLSFTVASIGIALNIIYHIVITLILPEPIGVLQLIVGIIATGLMTLIYLGVVTDGVRKPLSLIFSWLPWLLQIILGVGLAICIKAQEGKEEKTA